MPRQQDACRQASQTVTSLLSSSVIAPPTHDYATFTFRPSNVDLKYAAALCNNAACSARHRPIKYLLQRKHRRPRTRRVLWQWSTFNASRFGGRPHNAHFPFCAFSIHTYCRWVIPYFRRRYASFFLVRSDSFNEVSALKS